MKKSASQPFFITYANSSFIDDPQNLYKVFDHIYSLIGAHEDFDEYLSINRSKWLIGCILHFAQFNDADLAYKERIQFHDPNGLKDHEFDVAFDAVYNYFNEGYNCEDCILAPEIGHTHLNQMIKVIEDNRTNQKNYCLKCYECNQIAFTVYLSEIVKGADYSDFLLFEEITQEQWEDMGRPTDCKVGELLQAHNIPEYTLEGLFLYSAYDNVKTNVYIKPSGHLKKTKTITFQNLFNFYGHKSHKEPIYPTTTRFTSFLNSVVGYSLSEWLLNNDRRKLKFCSFCNEFYIAEDLRQQRCKKDECKKAYERQKKQKQRDKDPVKYV